MNPAAVLFGLFLVLLLLDTPVAAALGLATLAAALFVGIPVALLPQTLFTSLDKFPMLAVPFFILAGALMEACGMSKRILDFADSLVGHIRGGLAMVCVVAAMIFASISGAGTAATAAVGSLLIPAMIQRRYRPGEAAALQATAGAIGVIIPPSIPMIIFGVVASLSVGKLFIGGVVPGILAGIALMATAYLSSIRNRYPVEKRFELRRVFRTFRSALLPLGMPVIILGGIFKGIFTPTEAAIVAVVYTLIVGFAVERNLKPAQLPSMLVNATVLTSVATFLVATASLFGWILASEQIPQKIAELLLATFHSKYLILMMVNLLLLFVGTFLENISAIIILAPILMPMATKLGIDPYHMGIVICFNLAIGMATPPVGVNLFVAGAISKTSLADTARAAIPYVMAMIAVLILVTYIPALSLWLPALLLGK